MELIAHFMIFFPAITDEDWISIRQRNKLEFLDALHENQIKIKINYDQTWDWRKLLRLQQLFCDLFSLRVFFPLDIAKINLSIRSLKTNGVCLLDRKSTRLNSSHSGESRMPSAA